MVLHLNANRDWVTESKRKRGFQFYIDLNKKILNEALFE